MRWLLQGALAILLPSHDGISGFDTHSLHTAMHKNLNDTSAMLRFGVYACALLFIFSPIFTLGIPLPTFCLSPKFQFKHAERLSTHRIYWFRQSIFVLKTMATLIWGAQPQVRKKLGMQPYAPDPGTWKSA